ncbi:MAG TPA: hypothetical protein VHA52_03015 [Candidatus Babeliaceae bacterium]|nr:hypothetical protein [Candidatus Babeliaceae bacterium]
MHNNEFVVKDSNIDKEYLELFAQPVKGKMFAKNVKWSYQKNPIMLMSYDQLYDVFIYKTPLISHLENLNNLIHTERRYIKLTSEIVYSSFNLDGFTFYYSSKQPSNANGFYLRWKGDSLTTAFSNDSIVSYYASITNLSIRFRESGINDIVLSTEKKNWFQHKKREISIILKQKNGFIYLLLVFLPEGNKKMDLKIINDLVSE